ncbi:dihydrofolate reductase family protein [uncultured Litoreibacter sp.]|uniref:dihydrofolate reductase family protein n=1 Tax=uncultured Litoreibacter sp. TaxID=1392394 RepID=UPI00262EE5E6|nr:dihydrofolate reductase family protein [uncultured Litoreibacter sp.]
MREITIVSFVSLDGVAQGPVQPDEDTSGGFTQSGWASGDLEDAMQLVNDGLMDPPVSFLFGRKTYDMFSASWPNDKTSLGDLFNTSRKYVVSSSLTEGAWENSEIIDGDVLEKLKQIKAEDGPRLQVHGSNALIQTLLANDLVDELRLLTFPVVLGHGQRLFGDGTAAAKLKLTSLTTGKSGVVMSIYRRQTA